MKTPKLSSNNLVVRRTGGEEGYRTETDWDIFSTTNTDFSSAKRDYNYKLLRITPWGGDKIKVRGLSTTGFVWCALLLTAAKKKADSVHQAVSNF